MRMLFLHVVAAAWLLLGALVPSQASAANDNRLLIRESPSNVVSKNAKERLRAGIAEVVERHGIQLVAQKGLPEKLLRCDLPGCLPQIAAASGATYVLHVNANFAKESFKLTIDLWNSDEGKLLGSKSRDCPICDEQDLCASAANLTQDLLDRAASAKATLPPKAFAIAPPAPASPILATPPAAHTESEQPSNAIACTGLVLAVAGLSAVAVGAYYISVDGTRVCSGLDCSQVRDTRKFGLPMVVAGGAALAGGIGLIVWKLWPASASTSATVSLGPTGVLLAGRFK